MQSYASVAPISEASPRILLVDDSLGRRELLTGSLEGDGYEVRALSTLDGVIDTFESFEPDLALFAMSSGIDGVSLCGELRARALGGHTPVILIGEDADEVSIARALLSGADDYVTTPVRWIELSARVRVQLRRKRMLDALTRLRAERDSFKREASHDALTGLHNRRALEDAVARAMGRGDPFAVLFVDIDHFKSVNDTFGHAVGDEVLKAVAERLGHGMRPQDICARYGGEEFVILLTRAGQMVATPGAERHRIRVASMRFEGADYPTKVTVSIGLAIYDPASPDFGCDAFLRRADAALYEAKGAGRNCVVLARPTMPPVPLLPRSAMQSEPNRPGSVGITMRAAASTQPPPELALSPESEGSSAIEREFMRRLDARRTSLPILPDVATAALRLASDPNANLLELVRLVEKSPPIAARFLSIASSALYARGTPVSSIHIAVVRLGLGGARDVLFQLSYESQASGLLRYRDAVAHSFARSVRSAHVCRVASSQIGVVSQYDYLAGLLHDLGEAHVYRVLDGMPDRPSQKFVGDLVRRYHTNAGADVARAWGLPDDIVRICATHHDLAPATPLLRLVLLADLVVDASFAVEVSFDPAKLLLLNVSEPLALSLVEIAREANTI